MPKQCKGPRFRESKQAWYATVESKMVSLNLKGKDKEADAYKAWHRLMAEVQEPKVKPEPTVKQVLDGLLSRRRS